MKTGSNRLNFSSFKMRRLSYAQKYCVSNGRYDNTIDILPKFATLFHLPATIIARITHLFTQRKEKWRKEVSAVTLLSVCILQAARENSFPLLITDIISFFTTRNHRISYKTMREAQELLNIRLTPLLPIDCLGKVISTVAHLGDIPPEAVLPYLALYPSFSDRDAYLYTVACVC